MKYDNLAVDMVSEALGLAEDGCEVTRLYAPVLKFFDVNYLEVVYLRCPIVDMSIKFVVRICKPIPLTLKTISINVDGLKGTQKDLLDQLKLRCLEEWRSNFKNAYKSDESDEEAKKTLEKFNNIKKVKLIEVRVNQEQFNEK
ncbi:MAG TPA: hypothetical protein VI911_11215 [Patescibacteria group bacterium]|nr:hypothetical protein [Patescibacteria group bacterium]